MPYKIFKPALNAACVFALIAVIVGALNAHAFEKILTPQLRYDCETAVKYQFYHALALCAAGILYAFRNNKWIKTASWLFVAGIVLFCGSIYLLIALKASSQTGLGALGVLTPIGGLCFMAGWLCLMIGINIKRTADDQ